MKQLQVGTSHIIKILTELLEGKECISIDTKASNTNQYFSRLKKQGIELVEVWKPNTHSRGRHKVRKLHQTIENIAKAKKYLNRLKGKGVG